MCNEWIMCDTGIYPVVDEGEREIEVLALTRDGYMGILSYHPAEEYEGKGYPASWENHSFEDWYWGTDRIVCWQPKPALPSGMER